MKNLTKIFMAVAVAMFAFACVTDTTEDLGIKVEGQGVTELTLSLEESRTHLGEKVTDENGVSLYPLYWSEGDAIAVNGEVSAPLTAGGEATAVFKFNEEVTAPLCVVYPASAAATVEEGGEAAPEPEPAPVTAYPVTFLAVQPYTVGTFAPQAAPMYGYAAELPETGIQLNHLTGVLRLAIAGNGEKVTSIVVKAHKGKIAGAYTVDCTTGVLTPSAEAVSSLTVTFAEPLVLGAEATPVYLTVPAGSYGTFVITVNTEANGKMTVKFNSDAKPINAGVVREFSAFVYEANANDAEDTFIIDSKEALIEFAKIAGTFFPRTKAVVTADIDMTGYDWTPIANFGEFEFDGGKDEGYSIKGLNAPLFATAAAYIHNVNLTDVNIEITDLLHSGAIACDLYGDIDNCSASGTININNTTFNGTASNSYDGINHGGLVGALYNHSATNCTNDIDITITSLVAAETSLKGTVGGVIGGVSGTANECEINGLVNNGDITYVSTTQKANVYISGIVGKNHDTNGQLDFKVIKNCTNNGNISSTAESVQAESLIFSGISGRIQINKDALCENLVNNGHFTHNGTCKAITMGGISSYSNQFALKNCSNKGNLTIADNAVVSGSALQMAGLVAAALTADEITNCSNSGKIYVGSKATAGTKSVIAGLVTDKATIGTVSGCHNTGAIEIKDATFESWAIIGGLFAANDNTTTIDTYQNCSNSGNISVASNIVIPSSLHIGGCDGYNLTINTLMDNVDNTGNITVGDNIAFNGTLAIGGIARYITNHGEVKNCNNSGAINIGKCSNVKTGNGGRLYLGGLFFEVLGGTFTNCVNEATGDITIHTGDWASRHIIGGWAAYFSYTSTKLTTLTNCENKGDVIDVPAEGCAIESCEIGGFTGEPYSNVSGTADDPKLVFNNSKNSGNVVIGGKWTTTHNPMVGGFIGVNNYDIIEMTNCENSGNVTVTTVETVAPRVGGFAGHDTSNNYWKLNNCTNSGEIKIDGVIAPTATGVDKDGNPTATYADYAVKLGGFVGIKDSNVNLTFTNCKNIGKVTLGGEQTAKSTKAYTYCVGGFVGYTSVAKITFPGSVNGSETDATKGAVSIVGTAPSGVGLGGFIGVSTVAITLDGLKNYGPVQISSACGESNTYRVNIGGIVGVCPGVKPTITNCENYGHIKYGPTASLARADLGGIIGGTPSGATISNCKNGGKIEHTSATASGEQCVAGICGCPQVGTIFNDCVNLASAEIIGGGKTGSGYDIAGIGGGPSGSDIEFNRCKNYGTVKHTVQGGNSTYVGGIVGYGYSFAKFVDCENHGSVSSVGSTGTAYIGGIVGWGRIPSDTNQSASVRVMTGCVNYANIDFGGNAGTGTMHAGGIAGRLNDEDAERHWEEVSGCKNYGNLTFSSNPKTVYYGGIFGTVAVSAKDESKIGGTKLVRDNSTPYALAEMTGCVSYGTLKAIGKKAGLFTGSARGASCKFINSSAGGILVLSSEEGEDSDGNPETVDKKTIITADNLKDYLYSTAITADNITTDVITLLTEKPAEATHTHPAQ